MHPRLRPATVFAALEVGFTNMGCLFPTGLATLSPTSTKKVQTVEAG